MNKVAHYLQEHLLGEVSTSADARDFFSTDNSIFTTTPSVIVYPRNEQDVRKTARFAWQLAERGRIIPITARGSGTDVTGAAIGDGIMLVFPAHMNRIVELDPKSGIVTVEPGLNYGRLQQTLLTHERVLPPYPAEFEYCTVGGAVANNVSGEKSVKYGATLDFVKSLRVVLANGEVITASRLNRKELSKKLGLSSFEGEIYRAVDALIEENKALVNSTRLPLARNNAGYNISRVRRRDGSFDLTPLFVGSQGTLGLISDITFDTEQHNPETTLHVLSFDSIEAACDAVVELRKLPNMPSMIEMVDGHLLELVSRLNPNQLKAIVPMPLPRMMLFVEFDDTSDRHFKKTEKRLQTIIDHFAVGAEVATDQVKRTKIMKIREASSSVLLYSEKHVKPVPIIDDAVVPVEHLGQLIAGAYTLFAKLKLQIAVWGHAGEGNIHIHPFFDLGQLGDRQRAFKLLEEYTKLVLRLGGTTCASHNEGRLRGVYMPFVYGEEGYRLMEKIKQIFDPHDILNPEVKIGATLSANKAMLRSEYSLGHLADHVPRS